MGCKHEKKAKSAYFAVAVATCFELLVFQGAASQVQMIRFTTKKPCYNKKKSNKHKLVLFVAKYIFLNQSFHELQCLNLNAPKQYLMREPTCKCCEGHKPRWRGTPAPL